MILCNDLGAQRDVSSLGPETVDVSGRNFMSVKEAVRIAQSNNFMGLMCTSRLLVRLLIGFFRSLMVLHTDCAL